jgi:hypothetical protein
MSSLGIDAARGMTTVASVEYGPDGSGVEPSGPETGDGTHQKRVLRARTPDAPP